MIKILKNGNVPSYTEKINKITCDDCGCIFEALDDDFDKEITGHGEYDFTIICPCCYKKIYSRVANIEVIYR